MSVEIMCRRLYIGVCAVRITMSVEIMCKRLYIGVCAARITKLITVIRGISPLCNFALSRRSVTSRMLEGLQHCVLCSRLVFTGIFVNRQHVGLAGIASP